MNFKISYASPFRAVPSRWVSALVLGLVLACAGGAAEAKTKPKTAGKHPVAKHAGKHSSKHGKAKAPHAKAVVRSGATTTSASEATAASTERLVSEFAPFVGSHAETESLVTTLRSGRPTSDHGPAGLVPVTGAMGYGEVRLALKLAQGALKQQGIGAPNPDQISAALHGGTVQTPQGEQTLPGVLMQRQQGAGWAAIAQTYNMSPEDMMPPPHMAAHRSAASDSGSRKAHGKHGKAVKGSKAGKTAKAGRAGKPGKGAKAAPAKKKHK